MPILDHPLLVMTLALDSILGIIGAVAAVLGLAVIQRLLAAAWEGARPSTVEFGRVVSAVWMAALRNRLGVGATEVEAEPRDARIERLAVALGEAQALLGEIGAELQAGQETATRLREDISAYEQIADMRREEVEAIAVMVRRGLRDELQQERRKRVPTEIVIAVVGAVVGGGLTLAITALVT